MSDKRKIAVFDPEREVRELVMVPTSLLHGLRVLSAVQNLADLIVVLIAEDYDRFGIPKLCPQFDVYGPTTLEDPTATWKIVWTGAEDVRGHMPFARLSYTKALGWWDGSVKRIVSESEREMLIGPMPPAMALLEHAGLGLRGHVKRYLGRLCMKHGKENENVLLLVPSQAAGITKDYQQDLSYDLEAISGTEGRESGTCDETKTH